MGAIALRPHELISPQIGATTGREPSLPYAGYLESLATNVLPGVKEAEYEREKLVEEEEFNRQAERDRAKDAKASLFVTGFSGAMEAKEYFPKLSKFFSGSKSIARTAEKAGGSIISSGSEVANVVGSGVTPAGTGALDIIGKGGSIAKAGVGKTAGGLSKYATSPFSFGKGLLSYGAGTFAPLIGSEQGAKSSREIGKLGGIIKDEGTQTIVGDVVKGAGAGFVASGFNPIGAIVGALSGLSSSGSRTYNTCIIVTACSGRDSYEVGIAREFRNKNMDIYDLRGYYIIAEYAVGTINRYKYVKLAVKYLLVDKLVDYGEWALGKKETEPRTLSIVVTRLFLGLCRFIGKRTPMGNANERGGGLNGSF